MNKILKFAVVIGIILSLLSGNVSVIAASLSNTTQQEENQVSQSSENSVNDIDKNADEDEAIPTYENDIVLDTEEETTSEETSNTTKTPKTKQKQANGVTTIDTQGENLQKVLEKTGSLFIFIELKFPQLENKLNVSLTNSEGTTIETSEKSIDAQKLYYTFSDCKPGIYTLKITGNGIKDFSQEVEIKENMLAELRFTNSYNSQNISIFKIIPLGDLNSDGVINNTDEKLMMSQIQSNSPDLSYDLNFDGKVNIIDLSYISINKENNTTNEIKTVYKANMTKIDESDFDMIEGTEVKEGSLENIFKNNNDSVTLKPADEEVEISESNPVEISLNLDNNTTQTEMITIAPPLNSENAIESGLAIIEGIDEQGKDIKVEIDIKNNTSTQPIKNLGVKNIYKIAATGEFKTVNTVYDTCNVKSNGTIELDLGGKIAVKKVTIRVTGTKSKKLADIAKVEFLNDMDDRIPEPDIKGPTSLKVERISEDKITISWDHMLNVTGYEVRIAGTIKGKEEIEYHTSKGNMITLEQIKGTGIKDLNRTKITIDVCSVNGEWKSKYSQANEFEILPWSKPPRPDYVNAIGGHKEIKVTWAESARPTKYDVYYRLKGAETYIHANEGNEIPGTATGYTITNLPAEVNTYEIYVVGTNELGTGEPSIPVIAETKNVQPVNLPKYKMLNGPVLDEQGNELEGVLTEHIKNAYYRSSNAFMVDSKLDENSETKQSALGVVDNDYSSYWQKNDWDDGGGVYFDKNANKGITVEFDKAYDMNYFTMAQVENLDAIREAMITYWDENGTQKTVKASTVVTRKDENNRDYTVMKLSEKITADKVNIQFGRIYGYNNKLTVAEMRFYNYDSLENDINGLYSDQMHVTLRTDVTIDTINKLQERIDAKDTASGEYHPDREALQKELNLAKQILEEGIQLKPALKIDTTVTTAKDSHITFRGGLNAWQPLGLVAYSGEEIKVYVGNPNKKVEDSTNLQLILAQYYPEAASWKSEAISLKVGLNTITVPKVRAFSLAVETGGSLYINYTGNDANEIYGVRVVGGEKIPMLDLTKDSNGNDYKNENDKKAAVEKYVSELEERINKLESLHAEKHKGNEAKELNYDFDNKTCLLGATEIVLDQMMYSVCGEQILAGLGEGSTEQKADKLYNSLKAMEDMIDLFYSHKGLSKDPEAGAKNQYPVTRLNIRYHRMFAGAAMYAGGLHIGIDWGDVVTLSKGNPIETTDNGKYVSGNYFGWGISHEIGHIINESAYVHGEVTNNYYSILSQAKDTNSTDSVRFEYPEVYKKVTSGQLGKAQNVFTQLGLYWQLHLAFDKGGYNFKMYDTYEEQKANLIVARMDSYARDTSAAPQAEKGGIPLKLDSDSDNNLMRLACAATQKDILTFFEKWGMVPNPDTKAYATQWEKDDTAIWYINDEARAYQIEGKAKMTTGTTVNASRQMGDSSNQVQLTLGTTNKNEGAILGYEIIRSYWKNDEIISEPVAFVTEDDAVKDENGNITYVDTIETVNNRVFTYKVVAYDKYLNATKETTLEPIKISHNGNIGGKEDWEIETNLIADGEENTTSSNKPADNLCNEPKEEKAIDKLLDNDSKVDYVGKAPNGKDAEIIITLPDVKKLVGLEYTSQSGKAISEYEIQVKTDTETEWKTVCSGKDVEAKPASIFKLFKLLSNNKPVTKQLYFNKEGDSSLYMYDYDASQVKLIIKDTDVAISEINLFGQTGDNITFNINNSVGILNENFKYASGENDIIPKDSIVFVGDYEGNPAYNVVKLWYQNSENKNNSEMKETQGYELVEGQQIILAPDPKTGNLGETKQGTWIYWVEPLNDEGKENPVYKKLINDLGKGTLRAELYRVDDAHTLVNERLVSDTLPILLPNQLPETTLTGITIY